MNSRKGNKMKQESSIEHPNQQGGENRMKNRMNIKLLESAKIKKKIFKELMIKINNVEVITIPRTCH